MNTRYLEKDGPAFDVGEDPSIWQSANGASWIMMWRARLPGDRLERNLPRIPVLSVTTLPPELMGDRYDDEKAEYEHTTNIWFKDRAGWKEAYRLARLITNFWRIGPQHIDGHTVQIEYAARHWCASERGAA